MNDLIESLVDDIDDEPKTSSLLIAEKFNKKHKNVLRIIENLSCSEDFWRLNFEPRNYEYQTGKNQIRQEKMYHITKDGFSMLVMGFTGKEAMIWKENFINAFNALIAELEMINIALHAQKQKALFQSEKYWFGKFPHWELVRTLCLEGLTNVAIAQKLNISPSRVSRAIINMIKVGLIDPLKRLNARYQAHTAQKMAQLPLFANWGS